MDNSNEEMSDERADELRAIIDGVNIKFDGRNLHDCLVVVSWLYAGLIIQSPDRVGAQLLFMQMTQSAIESQMEHIEHSVKNN